MSAGRKPDYRIAALNKVTDEKNPHIGAGWLNPDGSISIVFNPWVTVPTGKDIVITLFRNDKPAPKTSVHKLMPRGITDYSIEDEYDIPF